MSSNIRKITLIILQLFLIVLVISLAFNFAFTPQTTSMAPSNENADSSLEEVNIQGNGGDPIEINDPFGAGNNFPVSHFYEGTTSDDELRIYNYTGSPDVVIDAPTPSAQLMYFNFTITDIHAEAAQVVFPSDPFDCYFNVSQGAVFVPVNSSIMGCTYELEIDSLFGAVFIEDISILLLNPNNFGVNFTLVIMPENATGFPSNDPATFALVENFTAPSGISTGELGIDAYVPSSKVILPNGRYYVGITLVEDPPVPYLGLYWLASNDNHPSPPGDDDGKTYVTLNHTKTPPLEYPEWVETPVDCFLMYHWTGIGVTEHIQMRVNATYFNSTMYGRPFWEGVAIWNASELGVSPISPRSDKTFAFDILYSEIPGFIRLYIDYELYCQFSDGTVINIESTYRITNGNKADWTLKHDLQVPYGFNASFVVSGIPSDWNLTSIIDPEGTDQFNNQYLDEGNLTIPFSISKTGGWIMRFKAPNYVSEVYSQIKEGGGSYTNQTSFVSGDTMRVVGYISNQAGPVGGDVADLTIWRPDSFERIFTDSNTTQSDGYVTFNDWVIPYDIPDGDYHTQVFWKNGTEVGFLDILVSIDGISTSDGDDGNGGGDGGGDGGGSSGKEGKKYLTVYAEMPNNATVEKGLPLEIMLNVTRWGNTVEGCNVTLNFLGETYSLPLNNETELNTSQHTQTTDEITVSKVTNLQDLPINVTEDNGIYYIQIETVNLAPGNYTFELLAEKEGYESTASTFEFTIEKMSLSTFFVAYTPKLIVLNPIPSISSFMIFMGLIWIINMLLYSPVDPTKFSDLYVYTTTGLSIDHISFGSIEKDEALMTGALAGISSLIVEATESDSPPKVIEKDEFTISIEYGEHIAASLFAKVRAKSVDHRKISRSLKRLVYNFENDNKEVLEKWTGDLSKLKPLSKYVISDFRLKPSVHIADLKYSYGELHLQRNDLPTAFHLLADAFKIYCKKKQIEKAEKTCLLLQEILHIIDIHAPLSIIRSISSHMNSRGINTKIKFVFIQLVSRLLSTFQVFLGSPTHFEKLGHTYLKIAQRKLAQSQFKQARHAFSKAYTYYTFALNREMQDKVLNKLRAITKYELDSVFTFKKRPIAGKLNIRNRLFSNHAILKFIGLFLSILNKIRKTK